MALRTFHNSIAILDLDGSTMIIDTSARDQEAHRRVQLKIQGMEKPPAPDSGEYRSLFYSTDAFYDTSLLELDRLNPGALLAIARLRELYTDLYCLTSRPDFLASPTEAWLEAHGVVFSPDEIRSKLYAQGEDKREQYISTNQWKAIIAHQAATWYDRVLFFDDDEKNRTAVIARNLPNVEVKESIAEYIFDDRPIIL